MYYSIVFGRCMKLCNSKAPQVTKLSLHARKFSLTLFQSIIIFTPKRAPILFHFFQLYRLALCILDLAIYGIQIHYALFFLVWILLHSIFSYSCIITLYKYASIYLSILLVMVTWVASILVKHDKGAMNIFVYVHRPFLKTMFSSLWGKFS